ncbi:MAG TPA: YncE family protein [Phycisphaerales bacterium]|nr:YncE family protein [Phycisphaerales bacterium]
MQSNPLLRLALAALATPVGFAAAQPYAYVTLNSEARTAIVDLAANTTVGYLEAHANTAGIAFIAGTNDMYTCGGGRLTKYDRVTNTEIANVEFGTSIGDVMAHPDGQRVYVGFGDQRCVRGYDTTTNALVNTATMPNNTVYITISNDGSTIFAANAHFFTGLRTISVMNTSTYEVSTPITLNGMPGGIALTPDGTKLYLGYEYTPTFDNGNAVAVYDTATYALVTEIIVPAGGVREMAFSPDGTKAYIAQPYTGQVSVIDVATSTLETTWNLGGAMPFGLTVSRDGSKVYVTDYSHDAVLVVDAASGAVTTSIHVGLGNGGPFQIKIGPDLISTCPADVGSQGGVAGADGALDNNDFIAFIDYFFASDARADVGATGGVPGADGAWDNNDFVVFIDAFFAEC